MKVIIKLGALFCLFSCVGAAFAATYYVQPNGGIRYNVTYHPTGDSCDGTTNANVTVGGGPNQHCAFNDIRYLWVDGSSNGSWILSGGDTAIVANTYPSGQTGWRIGNLNGNSSGRLFDNYSGYPSGSGSGAMPPVPSGTSGAHTRILGANYAACSTTRTENGAPYQIADPTKTTQIFGGWNAWEVVTLAGSKFVDVDCMEITDHSSCVSYGAFLPTQCNGGSFPLDDFAGTGINVNYLTSDITLQDLNIHGFPASGVGGEIGGAFTLTRMRAAFNGFAGWNFDANGTANYPTSGITASYAIMEWNGCNEQYPIVDTYPATYCYDTLGGGFGDGFSGQNSSMAYFHGDHMLMDHNVKDPFFGPHTEINDVLLTDSLAYANMGQTWKWNSGINGTAKFTNNLTVNDCYRMSKPITGAPSTFNTYLSAYCRSDGVALAVVLPINGSFEMDNDTFVSGSPATTIDFTCWYVITAGTLGAGGTGYQVGDVLYAGGSGAQFTVTSIGGGGVITGLSLTAQGQTTQPAPYTDTYVGGGHGTGATINITTTTAGACNGGPRIIRNMAFFGMTDPLNPNWSGSPPGLFCYSSCNGTAGTFSEADWTVRSNNLYWGFKVNSALCTGTAEQCASPNFISQPATTVTDETQFDNFNFYPSDTSPLIVAGVTVSGITTDYFGVTRPSPPTIGAVEPAGTPTTVSPTCSPVPSTYATTQSVTCSSTTPSSVTHCTIDGTTPTSSSPTCSSIAVASSLTLKAISMTAGFLDSAVVPNVYTITPAAAPNVNFSGINGATGILVIQ